jgi:integrase
MLTSTPCQDARLWTQERHTSMRRKRYQKGTVGERKHGRRRVWVGQWWEEGGRRSKVIGKCSEMSKAQAEEVLASILRPLNEGAGYAPPPVFTFTRYVEEKYLPFGRRTWKESTRMTTEPTIRMHLCAELGDTLMTAITREQLQKLLDSKSQKLSRSVVDHLRWHLSGIFKLAQADGIVVHNPAGKLSVSEAKASGEKLVMSPQQIRLALDVLGLRDRLIFRLAVFDGMRPGEILAIRLGNISGNSLLIDQRVYKGTFDSPKGRKGKKTSRIIGLSSGTVSDLEMWRASLLNQEPDALLFESEAGTAMWRDNVWYRSMKPTLDAVGLGWATFQVLRRTNASLARKAKVDDKVAADQRGHGLGVSLEVYAVSDLQQKLAAVAKLESEVIQ